MSKETYLRGFLKISEAMGVDPRSLVKASGVKSTPVSDWLAGVPSTVVMDGLMPGISPTINGVGYLAGLLSDKHKGGNEDLEWSALVPGAASYRIGNRIKSQIENELQDAKGDDKVRPVAHAVAEAAGPLTSGLSSAALGALIGGGLSRSAGGAAVGAGTGIGVAVIATLASSIAAAVKRRRTKEEQIESDKGSLLKKYLVPGVAAYDYLKRYGRSQGDRDEFDDKLNK